MAREAAGVLEPLELKVAESLTDLFEPE